MEANKSPKTNVKRISVSDYCLVVRMTRLVKEHRGMDKDLTPALLTGGYVRNPEELNSYLVLSRAKMELQIANFNRAYNKAEDKRKLERAYWSRGMGNRPRGGWSNCYDCPNDEWVGVGCVGTCDD